MVVQLMVLWRNKKQNAHLTINANALCPWKQGMRTTCNAQFLLQMLNANFPIWSPNYYSKANLDLVQVQCKMQNAMHDDKQIFLDFLK